MRRACLLGGLADRLCGIESRAVEALYREYRHYEMGADLQQRAGGEARGDYADDDRPPPPTPRRRPSPAARPSDGVAHVLAMGAGNIE